MPRLAHLAQRVFNTPLAIHPAKMEIILAALSERLGIHNYAATPKAHGMDLWDEDEFQGGNREGYKIVEGIAVIEVAGTLVQHLGTLNPYSGMTGYDGIRQNFLTALHDPQSKGIAFIINSPGGEVAGCFDLVDTIFQARPAKQVWAILDENACSAAYAIASACDHIAVPRTGYTGSVGVITCHVDFSQALDKGGVKVTFIQYGDRKSDGAAEKPLSSDALQSFQSDINAMGDLFANTVARNRGLDPQHVKDTQAQTYLGWRGIEVGFADIVASPAEAFRLFHQTLQ